MPEPRPPTPDHRPPTTDFDISEEKKEALIEHGIQGAETYFQWFEEKQVRKWFLEFDGRRWDEQIEQDSRAGRHDKLADAAVQSWRQGKASEL